MQQRQFGRDLKLAVNLSGRTVEDADLPGYIESALSVAAVDPASLSFEVTETAAIASLNSARAFAVHLTRLGCRFALDDFGAGFGSFYYLKYLPFDYVKIDGEFIRHLPASSVDQLILDSIVQMSQGLGKRTIAEFVGDSETVKVLKQRGVDYGQGYRLGRPRPVEDAFPIELTERPSAAPPRRSRTAMPFCDLDGAEALEWPVDEEDLHRDVRLDVGLTERNATTWRPVSSWIASL